MSLKIIRNISCVRAARNNVGAFCTDGQHRRAARCCRHDAPSFRQGLSPSTPKSDQVQISPAASPEILHHTVWRTWLFIAYSDERWLCYQPSPPHLYISLKKGWENVLSELMGVKRLNFLTCSDGAQNWAGLQPIRALFTTHKSKLWTGVYLDWSPDLLLPVISLLDGSTGPPQSIPRSQSAGACRLLTSSGQKGWRRKRRTGRMNWLKTTSSSTPPPPTRTCICRAASNRPSTARRLWRECTKVKKSVTTTAGQVGQLSMGTSPWWVDHVRPLPVRPVKTNTCQHLGDSPYPPLSNLPLVLQIVWKRTTTIGAAWAFRKDGRLVVVIKYAPPGNVASAKAYRNNVFPPLPTTGPPPVVETGSAVHKASAGFVVSVVLLALASFYWEFQNDFPDGTVHSSPKIESQVYATWGSTRLRILAWRPSQPMWLIDVRLFGSMTEMSVDINTDKKHQ